MPLTLRVMAAHDKMSVLAKRRTDFEKSIKSAYDPLVKIKDRPAFPERGMEELPNRVIVLDAVP